MIFIKKISLEELEFFMNSNEFKNLKNKPISKARANSYLANPRANKKDTILFMAYNLEELVGYRTIWADTFFIENKKETFGWLSGSWVHPKYRRRGVSTLIFNEVLKEWKSKLMYTNYAETSKLLYDKTEQFNFLHGLNGVKYYMRFSLADILPKKRRIFQSTKLFWKFFDLLLNLFFDIRYFFINSKKETGFYVKKNAPWNAEVLLYINSFIKHNLFQRGEKEFNWIQKYPWILSDKRTKLDSKSYYFSLYAKQFESNIYTIYTTENKLIGFLLITIRDGHLKIPYAYFSKESTKEICNFLVNRCVKMRVKTIIIYNKHLEIQLNNKLSFIKKKAFTQKYFITKSLLNSMGESMNFQIQTGDGDVVFT